MTVLLINSPTREVPVVRDMAGGLGFDGGETVVLPPLDLAYMAATLIQKGHDARIIDADAEGLNAEAIYAELPGDLTAVVATVSLPSIHEDSAFLKELKRRTGKPVLASSGISHPPVLQELLEESEADLVLYGECDTVIHEILAGDSFTGTARLVDGQVKVEPNGAVQDLDSLPLPARQLLPNDRYRYDLLGTGRATTMQTTRGCPYSCGYFCPYPLVQGKKWRARSPEHVVSEIEDVVKNTGTQRIFFRDATFTLDKERAHEICRLVQERNLDITWWCETRVDCLDEELLRAMKAAGCIGINVGVETGDEEVMKTLAKKGLTVNKLKLIRDAAHEIGLKLHFLLMIGLPKETRQSIYETQKLLASLKPDSIGVCVITPYPGTPLYEEAEEKGWIESEDWTQFGGHSPIMHTDNLSTEELAQAHKMLLRAFKLSGLRSSAYDLYFKRWAHAGSPPAAGAAESTAGSAGV